MKLICLNGSPKGNDSVTLQYVLYIQKKFPQHEFIFHNVAQKINVLEKKKENFQAIIDEISEADGVIWIFPLYALLLPSQMKRFIELIFEGDSSVRDVFKGKYAIAISTSIHFFDTTCHNYIHAVSDDLGMKFVGKYSADTWEILNRKNRPNFLAFAESCFAKIQENMPYLRQYPPLIPNTLKIQPKFNQTRERIDQKDKKIIVITDTYDENSNIYQMIIRFKDKFKLPIQIFSHDEIGLKFPCLGCMKCSYDNTCVYSQKDGFNDFWRERLEPTDIIIFAGKMVDRYLSSSWKKFFDRGYFMNHTPTLSNKQIGFLIEGPLTNNPNLHQILQGFCEFQQANCAGFMTDEWDSIELFDHAMHYFAQTIIWNSDHNFIQPLSFLGVSTMKLFRDDVYGRLRFVCQADHRNYKANGYYESFPQNDKFSRKMNRKMMFLSRFQKGRKKIYDGLVKGLVNPFKRLVADPNR